MTPTDRTVLLLSLAVPGPGRARFVEEWRGDIAAARSVGLSPSEILLAAARVAILLLRRRLRRRILSSRGRGAVPAAGVLLGFALVVADVPLDGSVPFVVLVLGWRAARWVRNWIAAGR